MAEWVTSTAKQRSLPVARLCFDYQSYGIQVSTLRPYRGKSGWLAVQLLTVEALGNLEQHLIVSASTSDGEVLAEDDPEKLLRFPAKIAPSPLKGEGRGESELPTALVSDLTHL